MCLAPLRSSQLQQRPYLQLSYRTERRSEVAGRSCLKALFESMGLPFLSGEQFRNC